MLRAWTLSDPPQFEIQERCDAPPELAARVAALWDAARKRRPELFDGSIVTVLGVDGARFLVAPSTYRWLLATHEDAELRRKLEIRPLAISGILVCPDGYVFGRRALAVTQAPGTWELVPSGGVELRAGRVDLQAQILEELRTEVGLSAEDVVLANPLGVVEDADLEVFDIVIPMRTERRADDIRSIHARRGSDEYSALRFAAPAMAFDGDNLLPLSAEILRTFVGD